MTTARKDGKGTPFTNWLRDQKKLDSSEGFLATDLDLIWYSRDGIKRAGFYYLIEAKNKLHRPKEWQHDLLCKIARNCKKDSNFKGLIYLKFENTSPTDGKIFWNDVEVSIDELIDLLAFEKDSPPNPRF